MALLQTIVTVAMATTARLYCDASIMCANHHIRYLVRRLGVHHRCRYDGMIKVVRLYVLCLKQHVLWKRKLLAVVSKSISNALLER